MSLRLKCPSCQAAFLTSNDALGQSIACPKCGAEQQVPRSVLAGEMDSPEPSVWVPLCWFSVNGQNGVAR